MRGLYFCAAMLAAGGASAAEVNSGVLQPPGGYRWEGAYIGGNIGGTWTNGDSFGIGTVSSSAYSTLKESQTSTVTGGAQVGYNYQVGKLVVGAEADVNFNGASTRTFASYSYNYPYSSNYSQAEYKASVDWYSSARVRVGLSPNPNFLVYATAGIAFGQVSLSTSSFGFSQPPYVFYPGANLSSNSILAGWIAGAGAEYALGPAWSVRAEALYMSLGTADLHIANGFSASGDIEMGVVRGGVNYQF